MLIKEDYLAVEQACELNSNENSKYLAIHRGEVANAAGSGNGFLFTEFSLS